MQSLFKNLFTFNRPESFGVKLFLRIFELFTVSYTIIYAWEWGLYILRISDVVLPLGLANYIPIDIFFGNAVPLINAGLLTLCVAIPFLYRKFSWLYIVAFLLLHLQYVARFSLGEIPHSSNLVGFSLLGLALGFFFFKKNYKALTFAYGFLIFFLGLGYTSASISKLVGTGITWVDGNHLWLWIAEKNTDALSAQGSFTYSMIQELAMQSRLIATLILTVGIVTEFLAFLVWWKKLRPYIIIMLIGMHIGIYYSMNIFFMSYMVELTIVGFPWYKLFNKIGDRNMQLTNSELVSNLL
ncbi:hypothetical protein [Fodinibius sp. AD559]|uniref:hypothetical protein n=1 Tax=Fodinibius sp. AD559 TaxID=3424179 RepID=UPI004046B356